MQLYRYAMVNEIRNVGELGLYMTIFFRIPAEVFVNCEI